MIELIWMEIDTADYQCTMAWPHHTDTATAPLATSTAMEHAGSPSKTVSQSGTIKAFAKDIPV